MQLPARVLAPSFGLSLRFVPNALPCGGARAVEQGGWPTRARLPLWMPACSFRRCEETPHAKGDEPREAIAALERPCYRRQKLTPPTLARQGIGQPQKAQFHAGPAMTLCPVSLNGRERGRAWPTRQLPSWALGRMLLAGTEPITEIPANIFREACLSSAQKEER